MLYCTHVSTCMCLARAFSDGGGGDCCCCLPRVVWNSPLISRCLRQLC